MKTPPTGLLGVFSEKNSKQFKDLAVNICQALSKPHRLTKPQTFTELSGQVGLTFGHKSSFASIADLIPYH